ncbi:MULTISPECIES: hypothetical protein [Rhodococcus]|uniref:Uncharacterized protein n=1 Tax=Rhodococcus opacus RKJ300 = JCM 13270 TaxID=1165867 RepID=I0WRY6_RHOOP|nr:MULTISPECIES: hypothetical protein [Rhodococcus]EID79152.1 hypothetical protein W59_15011 [Rhodococcus opacus RKJ300 = JCM 13270]
MAENPHSPTAGDGAGPWRHADGKIKQKIQEWINTLVDEVAHGGVGMQAGLEGIRAALTGKNPVWAAIKGLASGLSTNAKIALILLLALGLLLGPVLVSTALAQAGSRA